jgi:hypothetical protein
MGSQSGSLRDGPYRNLIEELGMERKKAGREGSQPSERNQPDKSASHEALHFRQRENGSDGRLFLETH